jgi:hypothetical protein
MVSELIKKRTTENIYNNSLDITMEIRKSWKNERN